MSPEQGEVGDVVTTEFARDLKAAVSAEKWRKLVKEAQERARIVAEVRSLKADGSSKKKALKTVAPRLHWSTFRHWEKLAEAREGADWERQLDVRVPPPVVKTPEDVRAAATILRRLDPTVGYEKARELLIAQFGEARGGISNATLGRLWREAGLTQGRDTQGGMEQTETVEVLGGGGGLAFVGAASAELNLVERMGSAAAEALQDKARTQPMVEPKPDPLIKAESLRDERGRLTGAYNRAARGSGPSDPRLAPDSTKRAQHDLSELRTTKTSPVAIGAKFLIMGLAPLITQRRGFAGLSGPSAAWLAATGLPAYQGTTLDKALAEMALGDVGGALWLAHGQVWAEVTERWTAGDGVPHWLRHVIYIDGTQDPYWTRHFAASGKVSRVGRIMPSMPRVVITGGPGVPLLAQTYVGTAKLAAKIGPLLDQLEDAVGDGELGRITVIDAEAGTLSTMSMLAAMTSRVFVTAIKGGTLKAIKRSDVGEFVRFRDKDQLRPLTLTFVDKQTPGELVTLRGVEMTRSGSRNPTVTLFATNASEEQLSLTEVAEIYLSRWPHQEQVFRNSRASLGIGHTHGYGGEYVTHVALETKLDKARKAVERRKSALTRRSQEQRDAEQAWRDAVHGHKGAARKALRLTTNATKKAQRALERDEAKLTKLESMPREIYLRDTTRDSIATCAKLTAFTLVEYVLREYFGGLRIEPRSFIERIVALPVTIRSAKRRRLYCIHANPRAPKDTELLRAACDAVNAREIHDGEQLLRFEVVEEQAGETG